MLGVFLLELGFALYRQGHFNIWHGYDYINLSNINAKQAVTRGLQGYFNELW